ncbi:MAG: acetylglutamate kinase, partial [Pseudomonadota bacterium]
VFAPVALGDDGDSYNVNADVAAGALAAALRASRVLYLTDVPGVLDPSGGLIRQINAAEIDTLIDTEVVTGGMIPKLETARQAVKSGVDAAVILDGRTPHALLTELFTEHGAGTLVS